MGIDQAAAELIGVAARADVVAGAVAQSVLRVAGTGRRRRGGCRTVEIKREIGAELYRIERVGLPEQAEVAAQKELDDVKKQIQQEKEEAIRDIRRQVAVLSVDIAEKVIRKNLDEEHEQMEMIDRMLDEVLAASRSN